MAGTDVAAHVWFSETNRPWTCPERPSTSLRYACPECSRRAQDKRSRRDGPSIRLRGDSPFLGLHDGQAYALLYNGILGDKRPGGGNVLTRATLARIREEIAKAQPGFDGPLTVYGERSRLASTTLERAGIVFKQMSYDVKVST